MIVSKRNKSPNLDNMIKKSDMNLFFEKFQIHNALLDVFKIIVILLEIDMALYSKNIPFNELFWCQYKKQKK